jgi:hypothetical protein
MKPFKQTSSAGLLQLSLYMFEAYCAPGMRKKRDKSAVISFVHEYRGHALHW